MCLAVRLDLDNNMVSAVSMILFEQIMILDRLPSDDSNDPPTALRVAATSDITKKFFLWLPIFLDGHQALFKIDDASDEQTARNAMNDFVTGMHIRYF